MVADEKAIFISMQSCIQRSGTIEMKEGREAMKVINYFVCIGGKKNFGSRKEKKEFKIFPLNKKKILLFLKKKKTLSKKHQYTNVGHNFPSKKWPNILANNNSKICLLFFVIFMLSEFPHFHYNNSFSIFASHLTHSCSKKRQENVIHSYKYSKIVYDEESKASDHQTYVKMIIFRVALKWEKKEFIKFFNLFFFFLTE